MVIVSLQMYSPVPNYEVSKLSLELLVKFQAMFMFYLPERHIYSFWSLGIQSTC